MATKFFKYFMSLSLVLISMLILNACVVKSDKPISNITPDMHDKALIGTWYWKDSSETGFIHIGLESQGQYKILMVETNKNGKIELSEYLAHTSEVGANKYLNVLIDYKEKDKGYIFVKYQVSKSGLELFIPDFSVLEEGIESQVLKGVALNTKESITRMIDSSEKIAKFILENDKKLYPEGKILLRANL